MVNHLRTLLLNINGRNKAPSDFPGEEYVPNDYIPVKLTADLNKVYGVLFGNGPDRLMLNYRLNQYMRLVHSNELSQYVTTLDSRVTYYPEPNKPIFDSLPSSYVYLTTGSDSWTLSTVGIDKLPGEPNKLLKTYLITVISSSDANVTIDGTSTAFTYTTGDQLKLPGTNLYIKIYSGDMSDFPTWKVDVYNKPLLGLEDIVYTLELADTALIELFMGKDEVYKTCSALWSDRLNPAAYRLGAVVVALGYKINDLRNKTI